MPIVDNLNDRTADYCCCSVPEPGEYCLEIFANDPYVDGASLCLVGQYLIVCDECVAGRTSRCLLSLAPGFLGPQPNFRKLGLVCTSHDDPYITATSGELAVSDDFAYIRKK